MKHIRALSPAAPLFLLLLLLAGCHSPAGHADVPGDANDHRPFAGISERETVHFVGTEPFWGGEVAGSLATYSTPEIMPGDRIAVKRFAGRGGVSWSGTWQGQPFALMVTPGDCSDGMSDRRFPFVATLQVKGEQRNGCAWTDARRFTDTTPAAPPPPA